MCSPPMVGGYSTAADAAVSARLCEIAAHLDCEADTDRAFEGLTLWRRALVASRLSRSAAR